MTTLAKMFARLRFFMFDGAAPEAVTREATVRHVLMRAESFAQSLDVAAKVHAAEGGYATAFIYDARAAGVRAFVADICDEFDLD